MTHCERLLQYLSDGQPHTHHELYGLHMIVHSRVSDLRKQGHRIDQWRDGDLYYYRLVKPVKVGFVSMKVSALDSGEVERAEPDTAAASLVSSAPEHPSSDASPTGALEPHPDQLTFYEVV